MAVALTAVAAGPTSATAPSFGIEDASVKPRKAFFDAVDRVRIAFRPHSALARSARIVIRIRRRGGAVVRRFDLGEVRMGKRQLIFWNGITERGKAAKDGGYRVFVVIGSDGAIPIGGFALHGHFFPVRGPHRTRGPIGEFGAPRSRGRAHEGFDLAASCGTPLAAVRAGKVVRRGYDPVLYGNFIEIKGRKQRRSYFYSHLAKPANPKRGELVKTQQRLGRVGRTGNARDVSGCHLHFEIHRHGHPVDPEALLRDWDRYS